MRKWICVLVFFSILCFKANSQIISNSTYSLFELGTINEGGLGLNRGLGASGIGLREAYNLNGLNPASYSSIAEPYDQIFEFDLNLANINRNYKSVSENYNDLNLSAVALWFRFGEKWGTTLGMTPYTKVNYNIISRQDFGGFGVDGATQYTGSGGLTRIYLGSGYELFKGFSLGADFSLVIGSVEQKQTSSASSVFREIVVDRVNYLNTLDLKLGFQYGLEIGKSKIGIGGTYDLKNKLNGRQEVDFQLSGKLAGEYEIGARNYYLPESFAGGISYTYNNKYALVADYSISKWGDLPTAQGNVNYNLKDSDKYSGGLRIIPNLSAQSFRKRLGANVGFYYSNSYVVVNNLPINEYGVSAGLEIPISWKGKVLLNYSNMYRGNAKWVEERFNQVTIGLVFLNVWGGKYKYD